MQKFFLVGNDCSKFHELSFQSDNADVLDALGQRREELQEIMTYEGRRDRQGTNHVATDDAFI